MEDSCRWHLECAYSHEKDGNDLKIEIIENTNATLKHDIEELMKTNKEKFDNVQVETRANTKILSNLISTVADIVERLDVIEQEQTEYIEKEVVTKTCTKTDKERKKSDDPERKQSAEPDTKIDTMEKTTANNDTLKETKYSKEKQKFQCPQCEYLCKKKSFP